MSLLPFLRKKHVSQPDAVHKDLLHDCNSLISALNGFAEFLIEDLEGREELAPQRKLAYKILESGMALKERLNEDAALPDVKPVDACCAKNRQASGHKPPLKRAGEPRILIVDDQAIMCEMLRDMVDRLGYRSEVVASGEAAIDCLRECTEDPFALVLTDQNMGRLGGIEFAAQACEDFPDLPFILFSGERREDIGDLHPSIKAFIQKPVSKENLGAKIAEILRG